MSSNPDGTNRSDGKSVAVKGEKKGGTKEPISVADQLSLKALGAITEVPKAINSVASAASASQVEAQRTLRSAIEDSPDALSECAKRMESDEGRIRIAEIGLEYDREKTKRAQIAADANKDNNQTWRTAFQTLGLVLLAGIKLATQRR